MLKDGNAEGECKEGIGSPQKARKQAEAPAASITTRSQVSPCPLPPLPCSATDSLWDCFRVNTPPHTHTHTDTHGHSTTARPPAAS